MKIAVTYDNGNVWQHFGKTENFKIYEVEDGKVVSSEVIGTDGNGHEALAGYLADCGVKVVICGGLGGGAKDALAEAGVLVISGAEGDADEAVNAFLRGELESKGVNCDHHDHHHEEEEGGCGGCGGGDCGSGCCGGCGPAPIEGPNVGKGVKVHYRGTLNDGTQFDSSYDRGETLDFICGAGMMIRGFDEAVAVMKVGEAVDIHLMPEEAYGPVNPNMIITVETATMPGSENLEVGQVVMLTSAYGQQFRANVTAREGSTVTFDANHEMAGKELNFHIELIEIDE